MRLNCIVILAACLMVVSTAQAQRNQLRLGDSAPNLDISRWVKGDAVTIEREQVYVVEFWATWCVPCRAAIPHLTDLQQRYENDGLTIIGVSTEDYNVVADFVQSQGNRIGYTIAVDNRGGTNRAWMQAAAQRGIPTAFIVDRRGRVQFIGQPSDSDFDRVLELVIAGRFDAKLFKETKPSFDAAENARKVRNWRQAFHHYDAILAVDSFIFAPIELEKFDMMMVDMDDAEQAHRHARTLIQTHASDPGLLLTLAAKLATDPQIPNDKRDLDLALEAVQAAAASAADKNSPRLLATQALVHHHRGETDKAVSLQRRAWMIAAPDRKSGYERVLRTYQEAAGGGSSRGSRGDSFR